MEWINRREIEFPALAKRSSFVEQKFAMLTRVKRLADVDIGTRTRRGRLVSTLGEGGFGTVWKVDDGKGGYLAYKIYHPRDLLVEEKVRRFERGHRAMYRLNHPQIVAVYEFSKCPLGFYMDFLDGPNLRELASAFDDPEELILLLLDIASIIKFAHDSDVLHRDIKPENIIAIFEEGDRRWVPHLTDFDLAWFPTATNFTDQAIGTLNYASPEQIRKSKSLLVHEKTTDVYSFAQLLFFVVTGADPAAISPIENISVLKKRTAAWSSGAVAGAVVELYSKCTQDVPKDRYSSFGYIVDILDRSLQDLRKRGIWSDDDTKRFIEEVVFGIIGHKDRNISKDGANFSSLSGSTNIDVHFSPLSVGQQGAWKITMRFVSADRFVVQGAKRFADVRQILNARIDQAVRPYPNVRRRSGQLGSFEAYVDIGGVNLDEASLQLCRRVLRDVIQAIES